MNSMIRNVLAKFNWHYYSQDDIAQEMMDRTDAIALLNTHGYEVKFQKFSLADFSGDPKLLEAAETLAYRNGFIIQNSNGERVGKIQTFNSFVQE